jgi:hypothetical protein
MSVFLDIEPVPFRLLDDLMARMEANNDRLRARRGEKGSTDRPRARRPAHNAEESTYRRPEPAAHPRVGGLNLGWLLRNEGDFQWRFTPLSGDGSVAGEPFGYEIPYVANETAVVNASRYINASYLTSYTDWTFIQNAGSRTYTRDRWLSSLSWGAEPINQSMRFGAFVLPTARGMVYACKALGYTRQGSEAYSCPEATSVGDPLDQDSAIRQVQRVTVPTGSTLEASLLIPGRCQLTFDIYRTPWSLSQSIGDVQYTDQAGSFAIGKRSVAAVGTPDAMAAQLDGLVGVLQQPHSTLTVPAPDPASGNIRLIARFLTMEYDGTTHNLIAFEANSGNTNDNIQFVPPVYSGDSAGYINNTPALTAGFIADAIGGGGGVRLLPGTDMGTPVVYQYLATPEPRNDWMRFYEDETGPIGPLTIAATMAGLVPSPRGLAWTRVAPQPGSILDDVAFQEFPAYPLDIDGIDEPNTWQDFTLPAGNPRTFKYLLAPLSARAIGEATSAVGLIAAPFKDANYCRQQLLNLGYSSEAIL